MSTETTSDKEREEARRTKRKERQRRRHKESTVEIVLRSSVADSHSGCCALHTVADVVANLRQGFLLDLFLRGVPIDTAYLIR